MPDDVKPEQEQDGVPPPPPERGLAPVFAEMREEVARDIFGWFKYRWQQAWRHLERLLVVVIFAVAFLIVALIVLSRLGARGDAAKALAEIEKGVDYMEQGDFHTALQAFDVAIELDSNSPEAHFHRGRLIVEKGDGDKKPLQRAERDLERAIALWKREEDDRFDPSIADARYWMGRSAIRREAFDEAVTQLSAAIAGNEDHTDARLWRSRAYIAQGEFAPAIDDVMTAVQSGAPELADYVQGAPEDAETAELDRALIAVNRDIVQQRNVAIDTANYLLFEKLINLYVRRGDIRFLQRRYVEAMANYDDAIDGLNRLYALRTEEVARSRLKALSVEAGRKRRTAEILQETQRDVE